VEPQIRQLLLMVVTEWETKLMVRVVILTHHYFTQVVLVVGHQVLRVELVDLEVMEATVVVVVEVVPHKTLPVVGEVMVVTD
jgi:hypothetical protein